MDADDVFGESYRPSSSSMSGAPTIPVSTNHVETRADDAFVNAGEAPRASNAESSSVGGTTAPLIACRISEPERHGDNHLDSYITYNITTQTTLSTYAAREVSVRRRYQDFLWLRDQLAREFPASILPPLPEKNRLAYLDRFGDAYITRRQVALQRFLDRVTVHPVLHRSDNLRLFLEAKSWGLETAKQLKKGDILEDLGGVVLNTIYKVKTPDERFVAVSEYVTKLYENLVQLEKLYTRIVKRQNELAEAASEYGAALLLMSSTEEILGPLLRTVGHAHDKMAQAYKDLAETVDAEVLDNLRDYIIYCYAVKHTLGERDQRQIFYEEITEEVEGKMAELDGLTKTDSTAGRSISWNPFKSNDPAAIEKLKQSLAESQNDMKQASEIQKNFSLIVLQELELFNRSKTADLRDILSTYTRAHITFLKRCKAIWVDVLPIVEHLDLNGPQVTAA